VTQGFTFTNAQMTPGSNMCDTPGSNNTYNIKHTLMAICYVHLKPSGKKKTKQV